MSTIAEWNKRRLPGHVIKARAGLMPESDWVEFEKWTRMNNQARVLRCVKAYARSVTRGSESDAIIDILACLRQYCECTGLEFHRLDAAAYDSHSEHPDGYTARPRSRTRKW